MSECDPDAPDGRQADGDPPSVLDQFFPQVYGKLKAIAHRRLHRHEAGGDLDADGLVHEVYLTLASQKHAKYENHRHLLAVALIVMRRILADHVRTSQRLRRGGGRKPVPLHENIEAAEAAPFNAAEFEEIIQRLEQRDPRQAMFVKLRFLGGMSLAETAEVMGVSLATAKRDWIEARRVLKRELGTDQE